MDARKHHLNTQNPPAIRQGILGYNEASRFGYFFPHHAWVVSLFHSQAGWASQLFVSVNEEQKDTGVGVTVGTSANTRKLKVSPEGVPAPAGTQQPLEGVIMIRNQSLFRLRPSSR